MKSLLTNLVITAVLSLPEARSLRGQEPTAAPPAVAVPAAERDELAGALAAARRQRDVELAPDLERAAAEAGAQVGRARRQLEQQLAAAERAVELAPPPPPPAGSRPGALPSSPAILQNPPIPAIPQRLHNFGIRAHGGQGKSLVIRTSEADAKTQAKLEEDLAVMSRIFEKALAQKMVEVDDRQNPYMGINVLFVTGSTPIRSLYLEGYGALFLLNVNFPLLPPPEKPEAAKEQSETDSAWEEAKRELYGQPDPWSQVGGALRFNMSGAPRKEYDEKKVDALKDALLEALKNATNIRDLKSEETITVCVLGGAAVLQAAVGRAQFSPDGRRVVTASADNTVRVWETTTGRELLEHNDGIPARGTIMTVRVKKSDVGAFAKGDLSLDEFRKKASITTYAGDAGSWGAGVFPGTP